MKSKQITTSDSRQLSQSAIYWAEKAIKETSLSKAHFAELLTELDSNGLFFKQPTRFMPVSEYEKAIGANQKKIQRYLSYESAIPADLLTAWSAALPAPYGDYLRQELSDIICPKPMDTSDILAALREINEAAAALAGGNPDEIRKELSEAKAVIDRVLGELS